MNHFWFEEDVLCLRLLHIKGCCAIKWPKQPPNSLTWMDIGECTALDVERTQWCTLGQNIKKETDIQQNRYTDYWKFGLKAFSVKELIILGDSIRTIWIMTGSERMFSAWDCLSKAALLSSYPNNLPTISLGWILVNVFGTVARYSVNHV